MNFVVVGCGRVGSDLAYRLSKNNHSVVVIDIYPEAFDHLPPDFKGRMVEGEGLAQDVLHRAGIQEADGLAAVTDSDAVNAVIAHVAKTVFDIDYIVVRNTDPAWRPFQEAFGVQIVSSASWGAQRIEELLYPTATPIVFSAGNGEVEIYECAVPDAWDGAHLQEMLPDHGIVPVSITRAGRAELPVLEMVLASGDLLHLSATLEGIEALRVQLSRRMEH
jgi:trk system potassium uptake protein